ncbi:hypothetical protein S140_212 [Shewanella sp. phage 1/40]|uniref:hypothetical protein n=1 Tax=Shewanella sp. phage 1/40 TaxID=1458860 RepID=UPI0004F7D108|nr:hypothetical protein S140_212 [Shewanella sp. phage 1/40]AHK11619.1 hypothetical protein S140_212 [Shewanella sp. phage 1/40]
MKTRLLAIKKIFNISSDVRLGESFHITGAPRREVIAGDECSSCSVTFMSIDDWGNELWDGDLARNSDKILNLLENYWSVESESEELDDLSVVAMYVIHGKDINYKVNLGYESYFFDTISDVIEFLNSY